MTILTDNPIHGIDISTYQESIDWTLLAAQPVKPRYVFIKAGEELDYKTYSDYLKKHYISAQKVGLDVSAYWFWRGWASPISQARLFKSVMDDLPSSQLPIMLDIEDTDSYPVLPWSDRLDWEAVLPRARKLLNSIHSFVSEVKSEFNVSQVVLYSGAWYLDWATSAVMLDDDKVDWFNGEILFPASYTPSLILPTGWSHAEFWQYTSSDHIIGINGRVDSSLFFGTHDDYKRLLIDRVVNPDKTPVIEMVLKPEYTHGYFISSGPEVTYPIVKWIPANSIIKILDEKTINVQGVWARLASKIGWINRDYFNEVPNE